jgi:hypothetical protein
MLPLVGEELAYRNGTSASLLVSALLIVTANRRGIDRTAFRARGSKLGRRPLLLLDHRFRNSNHIRPPYRA